MKERLLLALLVVPALVGSLVSCSDHDESAPATVESFTEQAARQAADGLRVPLEKARGVKERQDDRLHEMEKRLDRQ